MIDHDPIYCDLAVNGKALSNDQIKHIEINSGLDQVFAINITLVSDENFAHFQKNLHQNCNLKISSNDYPAHYFNGIITHIHLLGTTIHDDAIYQIKIQPAISLYQDERYQHLFNGINVIEIAKAILQGQQFDIATNMAQDYDIKLFGDRNYPALYRILIRDESLLQFFTRILNYQGLSYFFDYSTERSPLIISDAINQFGASIDAKYLPKSPHGLTLSPYVETIHFINNNQLPQTALSTGAPRLEPNMLLTENKTVLDKNSITTTYHANTNEQVDNNVKARAAIIALNLQSQQQTAELLGGGLLLAGMTVNIINDSDGVAGSWLIRNSKIQIHFDEHHPNRLGSIATQAWVQDANIRYQAMPNFGEHASLMDGISLGTPGTTKGSNLVSVNEQGHYHATLPAPISSNNEAQGVQIFDARMLHPMHSNDHSSHMTLPTNGEGILFWSEGFSGEPLLLGTVNNNSNTHPTTINNPQNAYWQDNDTNKLGFINEGTFKPYQSTGRNTAAIMEAPSYDPNSNQSYVRMGDAIHNDNTYPSQAAEPGLFLNTSGNYQEQHQGGLLTLAGNLNQNDQSDGFTPALRQMITLAPTLGNYEMLDSATAHTQNESLTSDNVTTTHNQDANLINKNLTAEQNLQNYSADTTDTIFVNQNHQTQGDTTAAIYNEHALNSTSQSSSTLEAGNQTSEDFGTHNLNLNHTTNQFLTATQQTTINEQTTQITTLAQNFTNYTGASNSSSMNAQNASFTANNASLGGNNFKQNNALSINAGGAAPDIPNMPTINQQGINAIADEQTPQKKEIVFLLDCPENPPQLQLCVNNQNPLTITPNSAFVYPLADDQKQGPIHIATQNAEAQSTLHPDVRKINMQYDAPPASQMPDAYFNQRGQLPGYIGIRNIDTETDIGTIPGNSLGQFVFAGIPIDETPSFIENNLINIKTAEAATIEWMADKLRNILATTDSNDLSSDIQYLLAIFSKSKRQFLMNLIQDATAQIIKSSRGVIIAFAIKATDAKYPFKIFTNAVERFWIKAFNWSQLLTPAQEAAAIASLNKFNIPLVELLLVGSIDVAQYNLGDIKGRVAFDKKLINDTVSILIISALVYIFWSRWLSEKVAKKLMIQCLGKAVTTITASTAVTLFGKDLGIDKISSNQKLINALNQVIDITNQYMEKYNNPTTLMNIDWIDETGNAINSYGQEYKKLHNMT